MTLQLILMRHAKSDWDDPLLADHERPLNARGRKAADALGHWLAAKEYIPQLALVSDATRTAETWFRTSAGWPATPQVQFQSGLYNASPAGLLAAISQASAGRVLVLAHNPGIGQLAAQLCATPPSHDRFDDYPSGATLILDFACDRWAEIRTGQPRGFVIPADL